jgi:hypothetical protein
MRWSVLFLVIAGCATSAADELADLKAHSTDCGTITDECGGCAGPFAVSATMICTPAHALIDATGCSFPMQ